MLCCASGFMTGKRQVEITITSLIGFFAAGHLRTCGSSIPVRGNWVAFWNRSNFEATSCVAMRHSSPCQRLLPLLLECSQWRGVSCVLHHCQCSAFLQRESLLQACLPGVSTRKEEKELIEDHALPRRGFGLSTPRGAERGGAWPGNTGCMWQCEGKNNLGLIGHCVRTAYMHSVTQCRSSECRENMSSAWLRHQQTEALTL
jgi:hypothetical protein